MTRSTTLRVMVSKIESMNIVYFASKDVAEAEKITRATISEKLAFCANIIPGCHSVYWWKGKVENSNETLVIIKTLPHLVAKVIKRIKELHSYEMPEIVSWKIESSPEILGLVRRNLLKV